MVYVQFPGILDSDEKFFEIKEIVWKICLKEETLVKTQDQLPVENLLDENYSENLHSFDNGFIKNWIRR